MSCFRYVLRSSAVLAACLWLASASIASGQEIEPRQYANTPVGVNFLVSGYVFTQGSLATDGSLPIKHPDLDTSSGILGYARTLDLWGRSGKFDASVPYTWLSGTAEYQGSTIARNVDGFGDTVMRLSANVYGAPSLHLQEFASYQQDLIVGVAMQVSVPTGQYDSTRVVNIGTNRWFVKPSVGVSKATGAWIWEATGAVTFFGDNDDYYGGTTRTQEPLYSLQVHVIRSFRPGLWASVDATHFTGGSTEIDGVARNDLQRNWRVGATLAVPVNRHNSVKFFASDGVSSRTGYVYTMLGIGWQYRWGGGV